MSLIYIFFLSSVDELAQNFKPISLYNKVEDELPNSFFIKEIKENRITEIVKLLPNSTAKDVYNLDINLI